MCLQDCARPFSREYTNGAVSVPYFVLSCLLSILSVCLQYLTICTNYTCFLPFYLQLFSSSVSKWSPSIRRPSSGTPSFFPVEWRIKLAHFNVSLLPNTFTCTTAHKCTYPTYRCSLPLYPFPPSLNAITPLLQSDLMHFNYRTDGI